MFGRAGLYVDAYRAICNRNRAPCVSSRIADVNFLGRNDLKATIYAPLQPDAIGMNAERMSDKKADHAQSLQTSGAAIRARKRRIRQVGQCRSNRIGA